MVAASDIGKPRKITKNEKIQEIFRCNCGAPEHMVTVDLYEWKDFGDVDLYLQVTADQMYSWPKRVWLAIKFIFGYPSLKWHSVDLEYDDVIRLEKVLARYKEIRKKYD